MLWVGSLNNTVFSSGDNTWLWLGFEGFDVPWEKLGAGKEEEIMGLLEAGKGKKERWNCPLRECLIK